MNFVFLGPPGAGKGTLAARIAQDFGILHISTGEIFREAIKNQTELGKKVKAIIDSGALASDEMTIALVQERLSNDDARGGYILDGFPRTIAQAEALKNFAKIDAIVNFVLSDEAVLERLSGRRVCRSCAANFHAKFLPPKKEGVCDKCGGTLFTREDDKPESIKKRLAVYAAQTAPLLDFYKEELVNLDASGAVEEVVALFKAKFEAK